MLAPLLLGSTAGLKKQTRFIYASPHGKPQQTSLPLHAHRATFLHNQFDFVTAASNDSSQSVIDFG